MKPARRQRKSSRSRSRRKAAPPADREVWQGERTHAASSPASLSRRTVAESPFPIVGVGASAGGLDAFKQLLQALPDDTGMAYVLVQHLSPEHGSMLAQLLATSSRMRVCEIADGMPVEANRVYIIPPERDVALSDGKLTLVPRTTTRGLHMPVDYFLRSLAEAQRGKAIGVVLSGTGSDGTLGLKAVKGEGGIAFAQEPSSAAHDGMPRSAIASGCVDLVLEPQLIAQELARLGRHPYVLAPPLVATRLVPLASSGASEERRARQDPLDRSKCDRGRLQLLQARDDRAAGRPPHGPREHRGHGRVCASSRGTPRRSAGALPGLPHHRDLVLSRPGGLRGAPRSRPARAPARPGAGVADAGLGAWLCHR